MGVDVYNIPLYCGPTLSSHKDRAQVVLDVNRCIKRIPASEAAVPSALACSPNSSCFADFSSHRRCNVQEQLTRVILRLLAEHKDLYYYQGFHDIVLTFLLVLGEDVTYAVMDVLVTFHIR